MEGNANPNSRKPKETSWLIEKPKFPSRRNEDDYVPDAAPQPPWMKEGMRPMNGVMTNLDFARFSAIREYDRVWLENKESGRGNRHMMSLEDFAIHVAESTRPVGDYKPIVFPPKLTKEERRKYRKDPLLRDDNEVSSSDDDDDEDEIKKKKKNHKKNADKKKKKKRNKRKYGAASSSPLNNNFHFPKEEMEGNLNPNPNPNKAMSSPFQTVADLVEKLQNRVMDLEEEKANWKKEMEALEQANERERMERERIEKELNDYREETDRKLALLFAHLSPPPPPR